MAVGEIVEALTVAKTAVSTNYTRGDTVAYVISIINSGTTALTDVTVTDNLGSYTADTTLYPLSYVTDSARYYVNGVLQTAPAVTTGPPLIFSGITIPVGGNAILIYKTLVNQFAPLSAAATVTNTATVSGMGILTPITAEETISTEQRPNLTITKSIDPVPVNDNETLTYTFVIQHYGNTETDAGDTATVTDTFDPALSNSSVTFNGAAWTLNTNYTYTEATGAFATVPGQITAPAATYTQDPGTGAWVITAGVSTLVVSGTV